MSALSHSAYIMPSAALFPYSSSSHLSCSLLPPHCRVSFLYYKSSASNTKPSKMKLSSVLVNAVLVATAAASPTPVSLEKRAATTMCGSFGSVATGGYTVYHNNWGAAQASSGSQCTTFTSLISNSFVWSTSWSWAGGAGQVKSYSNVALEKVNKKLSAISSIPSTWTWRYVNLLIGSVRRESLKFVDTPVPTSWLTYRTICGLHRPLARTMTTRS